MRTMDEKALSREAVIGIVMTWHGLDRESAEKYVDYFIERGERTIRIHHELVEIEG